MSKFSYKKKRNVLHSQTAELSAESDRELELMVLSCHSCSCSQEIIKIHWIAVSCSRGRGLLNEWALQQRKATRAVSLYAQNQNDNHLSQKCISFSGMDSMQQQSPIWGSVLQWMDGGGGGDMVGKFWISSRAASDSGGKGVINGNFSRQLSKCFEGRKEWEEREAFTWNWVTIKKNKLSCRSLLLNFVV